MGFGGTIDKAVQAGTAKAGKPELGQRFRREIGVKFNPNTPTGSAKASPSPAVASAPSGNQRDQVRSNTPSTDSATTNRRKKSILNANAVTRPGNSLLG
jgi:hypothetical protein